MAQSSDVALDCSVEREACGLNLVPTASTTAMLALGDALAVAVSLRKGFRAEDFAELHPGGKLGKQLAKVRELMHSGEEIPAVTPFTPMADVIFEMSSKKLGITTVQEDGRLCGVISDGDLRRLLEREGGAALSKTAGEAMNPHPRTIASTNWGQGRWQSSKSARSPRSSSSTRTKKSKASCICTIYGAWS